MLRAAAVLVLLVVASGCGSAERQTTPPETTTATPPAPLDPSRTTAPALSGETLDGDAIALGDFRGRPVLINVWSSW